MTAITNQQTKMALPIMNPNQRSDKEVGIRLDDGSEWVAPHGETREVVSTQGSRAFVKTTIDGKVVSRKFYHVTSVHRWIKDKNAVRYSL